MSTTILTTILIIPLTSPLAHPDLSNQHLWWNWQTGTFVSGGTSIQAAPAYIWHANGC
jgi:hypothetical protein